MKSAYSENEKTLKWVILQPRSKKLLLNHFVTWAFILSFADHSISDLSLMRLCIRKENQPYEVNQSEKGVCPNLPCSRISSWQFPEFSDKSTQKKHQTALRNFVSEIWELVKGWLPRIWVEKKGCRQDDLTYHKKCYSVQS
jgi:hypothetical protein